MGKDFIGAVETAKLVRKTLKKEFPGVKFYVNSSLYSGGSSINVKWMDGPTEREVKNVAAAYNGSHFDGMIDMSYNSTSWLLPDGNAQFCGTIGTEGSRGSVPAVAEGDKPHPDARKVVFCGSLSITRAHSEELVNRVLDEVCEETGWDRPKVELWTWYTGKRERGMQASIGYDHRENHRAYRFSEALKATSCYVAPEKAEVPAESRSESLSEGGEYKVAHDRDWTWVTFSATPAGPQLDAIRALGGRFSKKRTAWYIRETVSADVLAAALG